MNKNINLGVTGSIAAFKCADIYSRLVHTGHKVNVLMTSNLAKFITPLTLKAHSKNNIYNVMSKHEGQIQITHILTANDTFLIAAVPIAYFILDFLRIGLAGWCGVSHG